MKFTYKYKTAMYKCCIATILAILCVSNQQPGRKADFRNFYGISWRGNIHDNLSYAKQMGYQYVFYQNGMEKDALSNGLYFYIESPEYSIYTRSISLKRKYSNKEANFYSNFCATVDTVSKFPDNLAKGWLFNDSTFSAQLNFQSQNVVSWSIDQILKKVDSIQAINPNFHFGGFAWDVPNLSGDFWSNSRNQNRVVKGNQVTLKFWTGGDRTVAKNTNKQYVSYTEGHIIFYKTLFQATLKKYPNAKFIMEPYRIYDDWIKYIENRNDAKSIMPDMLCQESNSSQYLTDKRIIQSGLINKTSLGITTPNVRDDSSNLRIAAEATINGSWFNWYGRFGGTGNMPDYQSINQVPSSLQLIRLLSNWENINNTPINDRHWDGSTYYSSNAFANSDLIAIKKPLSNSIFVVFLNNKGNLKIHSSSNNFKVFTTTNLFIQSKEAPKDIAIDNAIISLVNVNNIGKGYILEFPDKFSINKPTF